MSAVIELQNLVKNYRLGKLDLPVLGGINLEISKGSFYCIMGPSGSGKSTLMYLLGLLDTPSEGKILLEGRDVSKLSDDELANLRGKKIGFIFQQFNLISNLTALENVMLPMIFQGIKQKDREIRGKELLASVGMNNRMNHRPFELSGGEQQRVSIARSLVNDPEILIADEPTGNLDSNTGKIIMKILCDLHEQKKKTIIIVTHDIEISKYAKELITIRDGKVNKV